MIKSKLHKPIPASPVVWRIPIQILLLALSTELTLTLWYCIQFGKANDLGEWLQQNDVGAMKTYPKTFVTPALCRNCMQDLKADEKFNSNS